ncbi:IS3 family transposase [Carbonactinospora thermoautotrophica]
MTANRERRRPDAGLTCHLRRGRRYTSAAFGALCDSLGVPRPHRRAPDNCRRRKLFASLKKELLHRRSFATRAEARREISCWIKTRYNRRCLHTSPGYLTPIEWEHQHRTDGLVPSAKPHKPGVRLSEGTPG